jgi:hypothetical protein
MWDTNLGLVKQLNPFLYTLKAKPWRIYLRLTTEYDRKVVASASYDRQSGPCRTRTCEAADPVFCELSKAKPWRFTLILRFIREVRLRFIREEILGASAPPLWAWILGLFCVLFLRPGVA